MSNEPKTIGGLFKDLECKLYILPIAMQAFIKIIDKIVQIDEIVKDNKDFTSIIATLRSTTQDLLGFRCELSCMGEIKIVFFLHKYNIKKRRAKNGYPRYCIQS